MEAVLLFMEAVLSFIKAVLTQTGAGSSSCSACRCPPPALLRVCYARVLRVCYAMPGTEAKLLRPFYAISSTDLAYTAPAHTPPRPEPSAAPYALQVCCYGPPTPCPVLK
eukprot:1610898-Rhodomonas_salina.1